MRRRGFIQVGEGGMASRNGKRLISNILRKNMGLWTIQDRHWPILIAVFITEMVIPFKHVIIISSSSSIQRLWRRLTSDDQFPFLFLNLDMTLWNLISWEFAFNWKREWTVNSWVKKDDEFRNFVHLNRGMKKIMKRRSTQINKQFMQLPKESLKKFRLAGIRALDLCDSNQLS